MASFKVEKMLNWGVAYSPEMQTGGKPRPRWDTMRAQVREAEELGYDAVVGAETQHDPFLAMALAAQEPSRLQLVTGIALAFTKSPVATAYIAWDLQAMSGGRFVLGLGTQVKGHVTRRFGMPWSKPAQRMKDYVGAMRACWNAVTFAKAAPRICEMTSQPMFVRRHSKPRARVAGPHVAITRAARDRRAVGAAVGSDLLGTGRRAAGLARRSAGRLRAGGGDRRGGCAPALRRRPQARAASSPLGGCPARA